MSSLFFIPHLRKTVVESKQVKEDFILFGFWR